MRSSNWLKKLLVSIAILIVLFQSFSPFVVMAVEPWKGDSWKGDSWKGDSWKGNDWEGSTWEGDSWKGQSWRGEGTQGNGTKGETTQGEETQGNGTKGETTQGEGTQGNGTKGETTQGEGTQGNGTEGETTQGEGTQGNGTEGEITQGKGTQGNKTKGDSTQGEASKGEGTKGDTTKGNGTEEIKYPGWYDWAKLGVTHGALYGYTQAITDNVDPSIFTDWKNADFKDFRGKLGRKLLTETFKTYTEDIDFAGAFYAGMDTPEKIRKFNQNYGHLRDFTINATELGKNIKRNPALLKGIVNPSNYLNMGRAIGNGYQNFKGMSALSKANVITAGVGAVFAGYDTYKSISDYSSAKDKVTAGADIASNAGDFLMNAGAVAAVIPGAQVVAGAMVAAGAVLWVGGKLVKYRKVIAHPIKSIKSGAKKAWGKIKGLFGK